MIVVCPTCQSKYKFDEAKLGDAPSKKMRCPKCKGTIEVINERRTVPEEAAAKSASAAQSSSLDETAGKPPEKKSGGSDMAPSTARLRKDAVAAGMRREAAANEDHKMPEAKRFSLAVIAGANSGEIFQITRPVMVLGRADSDIVVNDIEASRQHAQIEVIGERIVLYDLGSTNGTYVDDQKIDSVTLESHSEFRIGSTVFMVIITDAE